ncbi:MAG TPA: hypothetical protein VE270_11980 [Thermoleophilaceae bacterium]|nr:hypothetical protein [Thermoleophilaceae bacterium]
MARRRTTTYGGILGARLLQLENAGHEVDRADWAAIGRVILEHTASAEQASGRGTDSEKTTAAIESPAWSAGASGWVKHEHGSRLPPARRRTDGSYRFDSRFRYLIVVVP